MAIYQLLQNGKVRNPDGWEIDLANSVDPRVTEYNAWISSGGIPDPVPVPTQADLNAVANAPILAQIAALELKQSRGVRDALLRNDLTWLQNIDTQITTLRAQLKV